jgi:chromosomal replication initiation ATPase DnaA
MRRCNHCGSLIKHQNVSEFLEKVMVLIDSDNLNVPSRIQSKTHKRYFLYKMMRDVTDLTYDEIGGYFGRDHATVMAGIKKHETYIEINDSKYLKDIEEYDNLFQDDQRHIDTISC